ncbi:Endochitinase A1 [Pseudocercospora fuligena]|uniref:chitinase n=1 Tax=Pseudocercospora fuligena TaxID=685502 RepID=A0A8H6RIP2_9PEZI|nr:Endochitinase A1 [Pseudocercospora fuligena]
MARTCKNDAIDVVNIGFVNQFPDNTGNDYPGTNFGNACYGDVYTLPNGKNSSLLKTCPNIGPDVITCQQTYGKKIFLSIGGGYPTNYYLKNDTTARTFADFLWKAWGPVQSGYTGPRPWGNASVDGFDFDIESYISPAPAGNTNYQTSGYAAAINHLHNDLYPTDTTKSYYISGAPQCVLPDSHLSSVLSAAWFDFMFIQFYNTPQCSARAGIQYTQGKSTNDITFHGWTQSKSLNPNVRYYIGLPADKGAASDASFYLTPDEAQQTVNRFYTNESLFGGIMTWEATYSQNNVICRKEYSTWMKDILLGAASGHPLNTSTTACDNSPPLTESPDGSCGGTTGQLLLQVRLLWRDLRLLLCWLRSYSGHLLGNHILEHEHHKNFDHFDDFKSLLNNHYIEGHHNDQAYHHKHHTQNNYVFETNYHIEAHDNIEKYINGEKYNYL